MKIIHGDCLEKLKELKDNSVDSVVTDPPYGINFMGKKWDYDVPQVNVWKEVLRVLKPGGHALVACGTRTQHRMAVNLEDAGFEIRDIVAWVYGSGFPKSHNIGKKIDQIQGNEREVVKAVDINHFERGDKNIEDQNYTRDVGVFNFENEQRNKRDSTTTKGNSPYEGWGSNLKPAMELWTLCRKPLSEKTVAENVLKYGTGGINIDGCRVEAREDYDITRESRASKQDVKRKSQVPQTKIEHIATENKGRFPANLIHDGSDEVVRLFPQTAKSSGGNSGVLNNSIYGKYKIEKNNYGCGFGDSGSASRFFYVAKASKRERNEGLEGFDEKKGVSQMTAKGGLKCSICNKWKNSGNPCECKNPKYEQQQWNGKLNKNHHPTVKPIKLMRYLVRLITPKGGICLDPYGGSGSTALGCIEEKVDCIIIEREAEYIEIIKARVKFYQMKPKELF